MRPSSYLGLSTDSWEAYQFDLATLEVGRWVEGKLGERDKKQRPVHTVGELLGDGASAPSTSSGADGYRSALGEGVVVEKMVIPEDGIW